MVTSFHAVMRRAPRRSWTAPPADRQKPPSGDGPGAVAPIPGRSAGRRPTARDASPLKNSIAPAHDLPTLPARVAGLAGETPASRMGGPHLATAPSIYSGLSRRVGLLVGAVLIAMLGSARPGSAEPVTLRVGHFPNITH